MLNGEMVEQVGDEFRKSSILDKVDAITTRNFRVSAMLERDFQRFTNFCQEVANDNYAMGIKILLDNYASNIKEVLLFQELEELKQRVDVLEQKPKEEVKVKRLGFGGGVEK